FYPFEGVLRAAVLALKYRRCTRLAGFLAPALVAALQARPLSVDLVVPVPLSRARRARRGFNQSELLARPMAATVGWPINTEALVRNRDTLQQIRLSALERRRNVEGAFTVPDAATVAGKRVLLVDDVCTTGATLGECAKALRGAGAAG